MRPIHWGFVGGTLGVLSWAAFIGGALYTLIVKEEAAGSMALVGFAGLILVPFAGLAFGATTYGAAVSVHRLRSTDDRTNEVVRIGQNAVWFSACAVAYCLFARNGVAILTTLPIAASFGIVFRCIQNAFGLDQSTLPRVGKQASSLTP